MGFTPDTNSLYTPLSSFGHSEHRASTWALLVCNTGSVPSHPYIYSLKRGVIHFSFLARRTSKQPGGSAVQQHLPNSSIHVSLERYGAALWLHPLGISAPFC